MSVEKIKIGLMSIIDKASTQNITAFLVIVGAAAASIYFAKWELVGVIVGAALSYLFPKKEGTR